MFFPAFSLFFTSPSFYPLCFEKVLQLSCLWMWKEPSFFSISYPNHTYTTIPIFFSSHSHISLILFLLLYGSSTQRQYFSAIPRLNAQFTVTIYSHRLDILPQLFVITLFFSVPYKHSKFTVVTINYSLTFLSVPYLH